MIYRGIKPMTINDSECSRIYTTLFQKIISNESEFADIEPIVFARLQLNCREPISQRIVEQQIIDLDDLYLFALDYMRREYRFLKMKYGDRW